MGLQTGSIGALQSLFFLRRQFQSEIHQDLPADFLLHDIEVLQGPLIALGPHMPTGGTIDQLGGDQHALARFAHAAL